MTIDEIRRLHYKAEGKEEGKSEGKADLLIKQLIARFKSIPDEYQNKIKELPDKVLEDIGVNIFDMKDIEELKKYV